MAGTVVISVDAELGWGFNDRNDPPIDRVEAGRQGWAKLLELFEFFEIPATWGIVGHLFLDSCDGFHGSHPLGPDWFNNERGAWQDRPDLRFGGELIETLLESSVDHDIGCHTFSHVLFDESSINPSTAIYELDAAAIAAERYGIDFESIIFPRNIVGFLEQVADAGITTYRGELHDPRLGPKALLRKLKAAFEADRTHLVEPSIDKHGLVKVPPSMYLFGFEGLPRRVVETLWADPVVERATNGIDRAMDKGGTFHMWLHPNNLVTDHDVYRIRSILDYLDRVRSTGLTVETMAGIARRELRSTNDGGRGIE